MARPQPPAPQFTRTFFVPRDNYGDFIRLLRQDVNRYCDDRRPGIHQPVLPWEEDVPRLWFHVTLHTAASSPSITLAVRIDNLYLVGFKINTTRPTSSASRPTPPQPAGDVWWEFDNPDGTHFIAGSRWLGFGGSYADLVGHRKPLDAVALGRGEMAAAVDTLVQQYGSGGGGSSKKPAAQKQSADSYALPKSSLAKLVIMICEGVRFHSVYATVDREFDRPAVKLGNVEGEQVREWEKISEKVRKWAGQPAAKFPEMEVIGIKNKNDAARIVAIVKDEKRRAGR